ncbi:MAG: alkaline phosphatase family protein [Limnohabitans sp.]|nr:alkaline phosphatase family protein [Limnohabitans sp.]
MLGVTLSACFTVFLSAHVPFGTTDTRAETAIEHVLIVSVDGLRADALLPPSIAQFPAFARVLRGPHTLEARTDAEFTITLPNHISMLTGRPVGGEDGHGWKQNDEPPGAKQGGTVHANRGFYVASVFDVAHDRGVKTMVATTKTKFWLLEQSYSDAKGAVDLVEPDEGRGKIDRFLFCEKTEDLAESVCDRLLRARGRTLDFVHFAAPDAAGHGYDWIMTPGSKYMEAIAAVDSAMAAILDTIEGTPRLAGKTAIVLTADHGGGVPRKTHTDATCPLNFCIPFAVWLGGPREAADLYLLNPSRTRPPREDRGTRDAPSQPIRNGDAANTALQLLGLPSVPGSRFGVGAPTTAEVDRAGEPRVGGLQLAAEPTPARP